MTDIFNKEKKCLQMKNCRRIISVVVTVTMILAIALSCITVNAADGVTVKYNFSGSDSAKAGYAEGTITVFAASSANYGTYELYWADANGKLSGFRPITSLAVTSSAAQSFKMPQFTCIPNGATSVIAVKSAAQSEASSCSLRGSFNSWGEDKLYKTSENNVFDLTLPLDSGTHTFKIYDGSTWYGNNTTVNNSTSSITMSSSAGNCTLKATGGYYTFKFNLSTKNLSITYSDTAPAVPGNSGSQVIAGRCDIPASKRSPYKNEDILYSFEQISDIHMDHTGYYRYDKQHLSMALDTAVKRDVDFVVTTGDMITNNDFGHEEDWKRYTDTIAASDFVNPIYEGIGNHEIWESVTSGTAEFIAATGLSSDEEAVTSKDGFFEVTEPKTGDHFIFMSLEGGFYGNKNDQFTDKQMSWLKGLLEKYKNDGKNVFIIEHILFDGWGSGDVMSNPIYGAPLTTNFPSTVELQNVLKTYKNVFFTTGHTHIALDEQCNFTNENGTSAYQIHNPSLGCPKSIDYDNRKLVSNFALSNTEGYIVDVYKDHVVYNGTNMYYNEVLPACSYIAPGTSSLISPENPTEPTPTEPTGLLGDASGDGRIAISDASIIQKHLAKMVTLSSDALALSDVSGDGKVTIVDASLIQKYLAKVISKFPAQEGLVSTSGAYSLSDLNSLIQTAQSTLSSNTALSSYNGYQSLKKLVYTYRNRTDLSANEITNAYTSITNAVDKLKDTASKVGSGSTPAIGGEITVKFTNNKNWSGTISAYVWGTGGKLKEWPGTAMTSAGTNDYGETVYSITIDADKYQNIIFTNGTNQTSDITLTGNKGYYLSGETDADGNYAVASYAI